jgi:hypothetical protein
VEMVLEYLSTYLGHENVVNVGIPWYSSITLSKFSLQTIRPVV